jgi:hypothetical protein
MRNHFSHKRIVDFYIELKGKGDLWKEVYLSHETAMV